MGAWRNPRVLVGKMLRFFVCWNSKIASKMAATLKVPVKIYVKWLHAFAWKCAKFMNRTEQNTSYWIHRYIIYVYNIICCYIQGLYCPDYVCFKVLTTWHSPHLLHVAVTAVIASGNCLNTLFCWQPNTFLMPFTTVLANIVCVRHIKATDKVYA